MAQATIDVGGTFTDCLIRQDDGQLRAYKAATTPDDPTKGFFDALEKAAAASSKTLDEFLPELELIIHGTTLATNAVITGTGAKVGMITTDGFRDVIEARRGYKNIRTSMYDLFVPPYRPLVPRYRRRGVRERVVPDGSVLTPLDEADVSNAINQFAADGVEAIAICLLHSYANGEHEQRVAELCRERFRDGVYITTSHAVLPIWGEYERFSTTVVSASIGPIVERYLTRLELRLESLGFRGGLLIVQSDGLVQSAEASRYRAVELIGSGPAAAPTGALQWGQSMGLDSLISVDMGGTSFDICLISDKQIPTTTEGWVADERVAINIVDIQSIGAGGGSVAWIDRMGLLRVGPESAGADPGPACYGRGDKPTVTDADVLLGYVPADYFLGGEIALDVAKARQAVDRVGAPLGLHSTEAAEAIFTTANAFMADSITELSTKRGLDIRDYALVVGGGAGAVHAAAIADNLHISTVVIPRYSGLYSAFGMFANDIGRAYVRTYIVPTAEIDLARLQALYQEMEGQAFRELGVSNVGAGEVSLKRSIDVRYAGQFHELEIELPGVPAEAADIDRLTKAFADRHRALYGFDLPFRGLELVFVRLKATVARRPFELPHVDVGSADPGIALKRVRQCFFGGMWVETSSYDADKLQAGNRIHGPALIEEQTTTVVIPARFVCEIDPARAYVLRKEDKP